MSVLFGSLVERTIGQPASLRPAAPPVFWPHREAQGDDAPGTMERQEPQVETEMVSTTLRTREVAQDPPGDHHDPKPSQRISRTSDPARATAGTSTARPAGQREQAEAVSTENKPVKITRPINPGMRVIGVEAPGRQEAIPQRSTRSPMKNRAQSDPVSAESPNRLYIRPPQMPLSRGEDGRKNFERQTSRAPARPIVRVTIGRIEVKAVMHNQAPVMAAPRSPMPQPRSLAEYLKERNEESR